MTRTTSAYLQRPLIDQPGHPLRLFNMGANATRTSWKKDPATGMWLPGLFLEPAVENKMLQSGDLSTTWTTTEASVSTNAVTAPNGQDTADIVKETSASAGHYVRQNYDFTSSGDTACISVFVKDVTNGITRYPHLWCNAFDDTHTTFNLATGEMVDYLSRADDYGMEQITNEWFRIWVASEVIHTGNRGYGLYLNDNMLGAGGPSYAGVQDANVFSYWGAQLEVGYFPTSYIPTTTSAVTRTADSSPTYELGGEMAAREWTLLMPILIPEYTPASATNFLRVFDSANPGTDYVYGWIDTSGKFKVTSGASGFSGGTLTVDKVISDGNLHWISIHAQHGQIKAFVDFNDYAVDSDAGISDSLDTFGIITMGAWMGGVCFWTEFKDYMPRPVQPQLMRLS